MTYPPKREIITKLERRRSSVNGNPRWRLYLMGHGYIDTEPDSSIAYELGERFCNVPVLITMGNDGRLINVEIIDEKTDV